MSATEAIAAAIVALLARDDVRAAVREAVGSADGATEWLDAEAVRARYRLAPRKRGANKGEARALDMRVLVAAAKRGEIALGRAGRSPIVRRDELERWLVARDRRRLDAAPPSDAPASTVYELAVERARRARGTDAR